MTSLTKLDEHMRIHPGRILTQRLLKGIRCTKETLKAEDDIEVGHSRPVSPDMIDKFMKMNSFEAKMLDDESGGFTQIDDSVEITDQVFREKCLDAMKICRNYTYWFFILEKISIVTEHVSYVLTVIVTFYHFRLLDIIGIVAVIALVILLNTFGDWSRLREKYSHLHSLFRKLLNSTSNTRIAEFRKYAYLFGSDELWIDSIVLAEKET